MWKYTYTCCLYFGFYCLILEGCLSNSSGELTEHKNSQGNYFSFAKLRSQIKRREISQSAGPLPPKDAANSSETRNSLSLLNKETSNLFGDFIKRVRRNISPSPSRHESRSYGNSTLNHSSSFNATRNLTDTVNSSQPTWWLFQLVTVKHTEEGDDDLGNLFRNVEMHPVASDNSAAETSKASCPDGQVYDYYIQVCRPGISPFHLTVFSKRIYSVGIWMRANISSLPRRLEAETDIKEVIVDKLDINATFISYFTIGNPRGSRELRTLTIMFKINLSQLKRQKDLPIQSLKNAMSSLSIVLNGTNFIAFKVAVKSFYCADKEIFKPNEYTLEGNVVSITDTGETFQEVDYYSNETKWLNGSYVPTGVLTVCKQHNINCSGIFIGLTEDEYSISRNGSVYRIASGEFFEPGRFQLINGTVWVCVNFSSSLPEESWTNGNMALEVLTYVGLSVSISSFVLVLVTYSLFKELRTLPGINLINLSLAHLLADLVFLSTATVLPELACTIVAILLHYLFLVSFMWMSIIALETWRAFSKMRIQHRNLNRREKCFYLLRKIALGWLPPSVFVAMCVTLDQSHAVVFRYGGRKGCWISNPTANLFSFVLPVAFAISFNIVFFALSVMAIRKTNKQARKATYHTANRKTAAVFVKIFILMGFTWIFGFLQILVSRYFAYPFVLFTSLTGLYVALAFVNTPRVRQFYRALLCTDKRRSSSLGTDNTPVIPELNNEGLGAV